MKIVKRQWLNTFKSAERLSDLGIKEQCVRRFSEVGEVDNYGQLHNFRGDVLAERFVTKKSANILDVGCAAGKVAFTLVKYGHKVDGFDISSEMIKRANEIKKKNGIESVNFQVGDIEFSKINKKYDYVLALFNLLTFFPSKKTRVTVLNNLITPLKKDGVLIMDLINSRGSLRLILKQIFFKIFFLLSDKNRPFGDVLSNPMFSGSKEVLFQHFLSKNEIKSYLDKIKGITYDIKDYDIFADRMSKKSMLIIVHKVSF